jgi:phage I-like protein
VQAERVKRPSKIAILATAPRQLALLDGPTGLDAPNVAALARPIALLADGATEPPKELLLFPAGFLETTKGTFKFDEESCVSVIAAWKDLGRDYPFDYAHGSVFAMFSPDPAESGKAAGWFKPEVRDGACWASGIEWTPKARQKIVDREFRYTSPTFRHTDDGRIIELLSCALTNDPATKGCKPLISHRGPAAAVSTAPPGDQKEKDMLKLLAARLGLAETATEAEVIAALSRYQDKAKETETSLSAATDAKTKLLSATGKATVDEALGVIAGWKAGAEQATALSGELATIKATAEKAEKDALITKALSDGKLAPAQKPWAEGLSTASLKAFVETAPKIVAAPVTEKPAGAVTLSASQESVFKNLGVNPNPPAAK